MSCIFTYENNKIIIKKNKTSIIIYYYNESYNEITRYEYKNKDNILQYYNEHIMNILNKGYSKQNKIITEDLGKIFEMSICLLYNIPYNGIFNYSIEYANEIKEKLYKLKEIFPYELKHIAKNGNKYDFCDKNETIYLNAKTTKKNGKVCPQVIGQPSKKKFCNYFGLDVLTIEQIKDYIEININKILYNYFINTFDSDIIYYNEYKSILLFIKLKEIINWYDIDILFSHILKNKKWNESTSIMINNITIGEFQIHNNRDCIKFRWCFEKILDMFKINFEIIDLFV